MGTGTMYKRTWSTTILRMLVLAWAVALGYVGLYVVFFNALSFDALSTSLLRLLPVAAWAGLVGLVWAIVGGLVIDRRVAAASPGWPLLVHPIGLTVSALLVIGVWIAIESSQGAPVHSVLSLLYVIPMPLIGLIAALLAWLIPGSFAKRA